MAKQVESSFAEQDSSGRPVAAKYVPTEFIPYEPGDDFNVETHMKSFGSYQTSPFYTDDYAKIGGKYAKGSMDYPTYSDTKGLEQPLFKKIMNGTVGSALSVATKLGNTGALIGGAFYDVVTSAIPNVARNRKDKTGDYLPHRIDNVVSRLISDRLENDVIKEKFFPVYATDRYDSDSILRQMSDPKFWVSDLFDAVAFSLAAYGPVFAFSKAAKGLGLTTMVEGQEVLSTAGKTLTAVASATANTLMEAGVEAKDLKLQLQQSYARDMYNMDYDLLTDEQKAEVDKATAPHAANVFNANMLALGLSNLVQARFFIGPLQQNAGKLVRAAKLGKITAADIKLGRRLAKEAALGIFSEGIYEEGIQEAVQKYEKSVAEGKAFLNRPLGYAFEWADNFINPEGQKSMILGAIIGSGMGAYSSIRDTRDERRIVKEAHDKYTDAIKNRLPLYNNLLVENVKHFYKSFDEATTDDKGVTTTNKVYLKDGETVQDIDKVQKLFHQSMYDKEVFGRLLTAALNMDEVGEKMILNEALEHFFYQYVTDPIFEDSGEALEALFANSGLKELANDPELKEMGFDYDDIVFQLNRMKTVWDDMNKNLYSKKDLLADSTLLKFKRDMERGIFYERNKLNVLDDIESLGIVEDVNQINALRDEANSYLSLFESKTERDKLYDVWKKDIERPVELLDEYKEARRKNPDSPETKKLRYLLEEESKLLGEPIVYTNEQGQEITIPKRFSLYSRPTDKESITGLKNQHYYNLGVDSMVAARIDAEVQKALEGRDLDAYANIVGMLLRLPEGSIAERGKYDITEDDLRKLEELRDITQKYIDDNVMTEETRDIEMADIDIEYTDPEEAQAEKNRIEEEYQEGQAIVAKFNEAKNSIEDLIANEDGRGIFNYAPNMRKGEVDNDTFERIVADVPVNMAEDARKAFQANPDTYYDLQHIKEIIDKLEEYKEIYSETDLKDRLSKKAFKGYIDSIDKAIATLKGPMYEQIEKNYDKYKKADTVFKVNENKQHMKGIGIDVTDTSHTVEDTELYELLKKAIPDIDKILADAKEAFELGPTYGYNKAYVYRILTQIKDAKVSEELRKQIINHIENKYKGKLDSFDSLYMSQSESTGRLGIQSEKESIRLYKINPKAMFRELVKISVGIPTPGRLDINAIDKYIDDHALLEFKEEILKGNDDIGYTAYSKDKLLNLINLHEEIEALQVVRDFLESDFNFNKQREKEKKIFTGSNKAPTGQQLSVIRDALIWMMKPIRKITSKENSQHYYKNWHFIKGKAATGKTQVVIDTLMRSFDVPISKVQTLAPHKDAAAMIDGSITSPNKTILIKDLNQNSIANDISVVYIDEIAALTNPELTILAKTLYEINETRENKLRIYVTGDPSQSAPEESKLVGSAEQSLNNMRTTDGLVYMSTSTPLTQKFRSPLNFLNEFFNIFDGNARKVTGITALASSPVGTPAYGIHVGSHEGLMDTIEANRKNGRSKAIAVKNESDKTKFKNRFPEFEDHIFTYDKIGGIERQEVYIDFVPEDFVSEKDYNRALYTAGERALRYVYIHDKSSRFTPAEHPNSSKKYEDYAREQQEEIKKVKEEYDKLVKFEESVMTGTKYVSETMQDFVKKEVDDTRKSDISAITEEADLVEPVDDITSVGEDEVDSPTNFDNVGTAKRAEGIFSIKFPSYVGALLNKFDRKGEPVRNERPIENGEVIFVKTEDPKDRNGFRIEVLGYIYDDKGNLIKNGERYAHLGILSSEELENPVFSNALGRAMEYSRKDGRDMKNKVIIDSSSGIATLQYDKSSKDGGEGYEKTILMTAKLDHAIPLTYEYDRNKTVSGKGVLDHILSIFTSKFLNNETDSYNYSVVIYDLHDCPADRYPGVPYLIINPRTSKGKQYRQQSVRLNPNKISKDHEIITVLQKFYEDLDVVQKFLGRELGEKEFNNVIEFFAKNYHVVNDSIEFNRDINDWEKYNKLAEGGHLIPIEKAKYNILKNELIEPLIKHLHGIGSVKVRVNSIEEMREKFDLKDDLTDSEYRYEFIEKNRGVYIYDKNNPEDKGQYKYEDGLRRDKSPVQYKLNVLAKANNDVNGEVFRVEHKSTRTKTGEKKSKPSHYTSAKSILDTGTISTGYFMFLKGFLKQEGKVLMSEEVSENEKGEKVTKKRYHRFVDESDVDVMEEFVLKEGLVSEEELRAKKEELSIKPITAGLIRNIINIDGARHSNLRTPLPMNYINLKGESIDGKSADEKQNYAELEEMLETNLIDILPTSIGIKELKDIPYDLTKEGKKKDVIDKAFDKTGDVIDKTAKKVIKRLKKKPTKNTGADSEAKDIDNKNEPKNWMPNQKKGKLRSKIITMAEMKVMLPHESLKTLRFLKKQQLDRITGDVGVWGRFVDGIKYLAEDPDTGKIYKNVARHEVFHQVWNNYLNADERRQITEMAKDEFNDWHKFPSIEELLAVKFHMYRRNMLESIGDFFKALFNQLKKLFGLYERNIDTIDNLFHQIRYGLLDHRTNLNDNMIRNFKDINRVFGSTDVYIKGLNYVRRLMSKYRFDGINDVPSTRFEIYEQIKQDTIDQVRAFEKDPDKNAVALNVLNKVSENLDELLDNLFPELHLYKSAKYYSDLYQDLLEDTEKTEEEKGTLYHDLIENSKRDTETTISDDIKEFLALTRILQPKKEETDLDIESNEFFSWRYVYAKIMELFEGLNFDKDNIKEQIKESFGSEKLNTNERSIFHHIKKLYDIIETQTLEAVSMPDTHRFVDNEVYVYSTDGSSVSHIDISNHPVFRDPNNNTIFKIEQKPEETSEEFIDRIALATDYYWDEIAFEKKRYWAENVLSQMISHFNSHRQRHPKIGEKVSKFGGFEVKFTYAKGGAVINGIKSAIVSAIQDKFQTKEDLENYRSYHNKVNQSQNGDPLEITRAFLNYIGLNDYAHGLTSHKIRAIKRDIEVFIDTAINTIGKDLNQDGDNIDQLIRDGADPEEIPTQNTIGTILQDYGSTLVGRLGDAVSMLEDISRILTSTDANGERRYNAVLSNQASKNIFQLIETHFNKRSKTKTELQINEKYNSKFWKGNIFIKKFNVIHGLVDYDGLEYTTYSGRTGSVMFDREKRTDTFFRMFSLGFVSNLIDSWKNQPRYTQFVAPNERSTGFSAEINLLKTDKLVKAVEYTIKQILERDETLTERYKDYNPESHIGFTIIDKVLGERKIIKTSEDAKLAKEEGKEKWVDINQLAREIYDALDEQSKDYTSKLIEDNVAFDSRLPQATKIDAFIDKEKYGDWSVAQLPKNNGGYLQLFETNAQFNQRMIDEGKGHITTENMRDYNESKQFAVKKEHIQPFVSLFYINNYINGYHFDQLVAGDMASYKSNDDFVKRLNTMLAPGYAPYINDSYGMGRKTRVAVFKDLTGEKEDIRKFLSAFLSEDEIPEVLQKFEDSGYELTDGQSLGLPEFMERMDRSFGKKLGNIRKPVYSHIDANGVSTEIKTSLAMLDDTTEDSVVNTQPRLKKLVNKMREANVDMIVFGSAMKTGKIHNENSFNDIIDNDLEIHPDSIFELDNRDFRIQQDPRDLIEGSVAHPTQLGYLLKLYGINDILANSTYNAIANIIKFNRKDFVDFINRNRNEKFRHVLTRYAKKGTQDDLLNLISEGIDINFPSIASRLVTHFIASAFKNTVKFRYPGSKLILQSSAGMQKSFEDAGEEIPDNLKKRLRFKLDENGRFYAEVILPKGMLDVTIEKQIQNSLDDNTDPEIAFMFEGQISKDALGFRIPSSELHSAVPLKVTGFYDSKGTNIIIAPEELVPLHGSDFDVDSLFVLKRNYHGAYKKGKVPVGYEEIIKNGKTQYAWSKNSEFIDEHIRKNKRTARELNEAYHQNMIIENFISVTSDSKNIKRMTTPISFKDLSDDAEEMNKLNGVDYKTLDVHDPLHHQIIHDAIFSGKRGIGIVMNMLKALSYMHGAIEERKEKGESRFKKGPIITSTKKTRTILKGDNKIEVPIEIKFDGKTWNEISDYDIEGEELGFRFDSIGNASLDNTKWMILPALNLSNETMNSYLTLYAHGLSRRTANMYMSQPILKYLNIHGRFKAANLYNDLKDYFSSRTEPEFNINTDELVKTLSAKEVVNNVKVQKYKYDSIDKLLAQERKEKGSLSAEEEKFLALQYNVYKQFETLKYLGQNIADVGMLVNVTKRLSTDVSEIEELMSNVRRIAGHTGDEQKVNETEEQYSKRILHHVRDDDSSFPYYMENFFKSNPHITESITTVQTILNILNDEFTIYSKNFRRVANKIIDNIHIQLDKNEGLTKTKIREEFVKFVMSTLVDRSEMKPIMWNNYMGDDSMLTGINAFNQRFCMMVKAAKQYDIRKRVLSGSNPSERYEGNPFLQSLTVIPDARTKLDKIVFHAPSKMEMSDISLYRSAFERLNTLQLTEVGKKTNIDYIVQNKEPVEGEGFTEFQKMFVTYAMINYGMHFGLRNYSTLLPGMIYKNISDKLILRLNEIKGMKKEELDPIIEAFEIQLVTNYPDSLWYKRVKIKPTENGEKEIEVPTRYGRTIKKTVTQYDGFDEEGNYYDRMFKSAKEINWPKYHVENFDNKRISIFRIQNVDTRYGEYYGKTAQYVRVGNKNNSPFYNLESINDIANYDVNKAFNTKVRHVKGHVTEHNTLKTTVYDFKVNDVINVSEYNDSAKLYEKAYTVLDILPGNVYKLSPKDASEKPFSKGYDAYVGKAAEQLHKKVTKLLRAKNEPFRAGSRDRTYYLKHDLAKGRARRLQLNNELFGGENVIRESPRASGIAVYIDNDALLKYVYGEQLKLFNKGYSIKNYVKQTDQLFNESIDKPELWNKFSDALFALDDNEVEFKEQLQSMYNGKSIEEVISTVENDLTENINKYNDANFLLEFLRMAKPHISKLQPVFGGDTDLRPGRLAEFRPDGMLMLDYNQISQYVTNYPENRNTDFLNRLIIHELGHGLTISQLREDKTFKDELEYKIRQLGKANPELVTKYMNEFDDSEEFISELWSNKEFYDDINRSQPSVDMNKGLKSIIQDIIDWIKSWLGIKDYRMADRLKSYIRDNLKPMEYESREDLEMRGYYITKGFDISDMERMRDQGLRYTVGRDDNGNQLDYYIDNRDQSHLRRISDRITGFLGIFVKRDDKRTYGERRADYVWRYTSKDKKRVISDHGARGVEMTYDEYMEFAEKVNIESQVRGNILHLMNEKIIDSIYNNGARQTEIDNEITRLAFSDHEVTDSKDVVHTIKLSIDINEFNWYDNNKEDIYRQHKINIFDNIPQDHKDYVMSEVIVGLKELGFAGAIDMLIKHSNGRFSLKDLNTGLSFDKITTNRLLMFGEQNRQLMDSSRDLKKLQLMIYAIMLKANNPGIQFDDLSIMWIPSKRNATNYDGLRRVEVEDFMNMVVMFFKDKSLLKKHGINEDIYNILLSKDKEIFNPSEYTNEYVSEPEGMRKSEKEIHADIVTELQMTDEDPSVIAQRYITQLEHILNRTRVQDKIGKSKFENLPYRDQVKARILVHKINQIKQDPNVSLELNPQDDVAFFQSVFGAYSSMPLPFIQVWKQYKDEQKYKATESHRKKMIGFQALNRAVLNEYYEKNPVISKRYINNANYKKIYGFAYKEDEFNGTNQLRLIKEDDIEWTDGSLTEKQKALLKFLNDSYRDYFYGPKAYGNSVITSFKEYGIMKDLSVVDLHNYGLGSENAWKWYEGWFPKIEKMQSEEIFDFGDGSYVRGIVNPEFWRRQWMYSKSYYRENKFEGRTHKFMVLPLKYLGNFNIDNNREYSYNLEMQFDKFTRGIEYKKHMDPVYAYAESLRGYIEAIRNEDQPMYHNTAVMFEKKITQDILGRYIRQDILRKKLRPYGTPSDDSEIRIDAILQMAKNWVSATTMWLKPFTGAGNGLHAYLLFLKDGIKGSIGTRFFGIDKLSVDYTLSDSIKASELYFTEFVANTMLGKMEQDKIWLLLNKFQYLPDNFDYKSADKYMLSLRNRIVDKSSMYVFQRIPEEFVSVITMVAQLLHMRHATDTYKDGKEKGKRKRIFDCYEVVKLDNGEYDVQWTAEKRGYLKTGRGEMTSYQEITELLPREIAVMKRVYERMQGSYRQEEAAAIEVYVAGRILMQLKKYTPQILIGAFRSRYTDMDLGMLKETSERKDGETVYQWLGRINEGKYRILGKFLFSMIMFNSGNPDYKWKNLSPEMKQHMIDGALTLGMWFTHYIAYLKMFGDRDDNDTMKRWWKMYLLENFSQQYNPVEILKLTSHQINPVALTRSLKAVGGAGQFMVSLGYLALGNEEAAYSAKGDLKGSYELKKSIPVLASSIDFAKRLAHLESGIIKTEYINKWR